MHRHRDAKEKNQTPRYPHGPRFSQPSSLGRGVAAGASRALQGRGYPGGLRGNGPRTPWPPCARQKQNPAGKDKYRTLRLSGFLETLPNVLVRWARTQRSARDTRGRGHPCAVSEPGDKALILF